MNKNIKAIIDDTPIHRELLRKLSFFYLSSFSETKKGLIVNHKRK